jgi:hypothetical protein
MIETLIVPAVGLLVLTSLALLVVQDWRWTVLFLSLQYVGVFVLVAQSWPLEKAIIKLVAGWIAAAILGTSQIGTVETELERQLRPSGWGFRLLVGALMVTLSFNLVDNLQIWIPGVGLEQGIGALLLLSVGFAILGLSGHPLRVLLGLLVIFAGFELLYAVVEDASLMAGLLAVVNLAIALIGIYLFYQYQQQEAEARQ